MRFLGDYIDMLVKAATYEKMQDKKIFGNSLGPALGKFVRAYPTETKLADWLSRYNRFLYKDAKHDMILPSGRLEHRFTSREVVLSLFITKELGEKLAALSGKDRKAKNDEAFL